jgi:hypothetical protein
MKFQFIGSGSNWNEASGTSTHDLRADYIRKGLRVWKETRRKSYWVEDQCEDHTKLARTCVAPTAARLSKTA